MNSTSTHIAQKMIDEYLDAINEVFGSEYRSKMVVEPRGSSILVKHPDVVEGELVSLGYMRILTRNLLSGSHRRQTA